MVFDDDDFKISMDDIKDMVSELFGEKIEKVDAASAKELLKQETDEFMKIGLEEINEFSAAEQDESSVLKDYETEDTLKPAPANPVELRKQIELEIREKVERELADEKSRKKEEMLKRIEEAKKDSAAYASELSSAAAAKKDTGLSFQERMQIIEMFDYSQKLFAALLSKLIKKPAVENMMLKTLEKSVMKFQDILKKANVNQYGKVRGDGTIETARLAANLNAVYLPEEKKNEKFYSALKYIFEERLIAAELVTGIEVKDNLLSNLFTQLDSVFEKRRYPKKLADIFSSKIIPETTLKPGE